VLTLKEGSRNTKVPSARRRPSIGNVRVPSVEEKLVWRWPLKNAFLPFRPLNESTRQRMVFVDWLLMDTRGI